MSHILFYFITGAKLNFAEKEDGQSDWSYECKRLKINK